MNCPVHCQVEWINEEAHKKFARVNSTKHIWKADEEDYVLHQLKNKGVLVIVRVHKDTIVLGIFPSTRDPKSYRRYIILKRWLADPYLGGTEVDKTNEGARAFLEAVVKDVTERPDSLKEFVFDTKADPAQ